MPYIGVNSVYDINVNETITLSTFTMLINMINANNHYIIRIHDNSNETNPISIATYQKTADNVITLSYMSNEYTLSYIKYTLSNNIITQEGPINYNIKNKQNTISDLTTIRSNAANGQTAYGWGNHANAGYAKETDVKPFVITITNTNETYTCDKTFAEYKAAIDSNKTINFVITDGTSKALYENAAIMPMLDSDGNGGIYCYLISGNQQIGVSYVNSNGSTTFTVSVTDIIPNIDTSIPTTLTDNTVPSTKLLIDTFVNNQQTLYLLVTSVNDINTYDELEVVTEFVQNMTAFNFNAANHKLGSKITENTFLSYDRFLPYIDKGYFVKLCFYGKINNGYYVTIDLGLIHDIGFNNVHYNIVCISQFGLIYGNVSKDDNGNIKFTFERPIYQSTIKTDYQRLIEAESRITALETALANVQTQLQNI